MRVQTSKRPATRAGIRRWLVNHVVNPEMALVLRSPLHGLASGSVVLLSYEGQRTGHSHTLPVQYVREGEAVYAVVGDAQAKTWWRNLRGGCGVRLWLRGRKFIGRADVVSDGGEAVRGVSVYLDRFPGMARRWGIRRRADGGLDGEDVLRATAGLVLVRVNLDVLPR